MPHLFLVFLRRLDLALVMGRGWAREGPLGKHRALE
jgi:hypothetical protein